MKLLSSLALSSLLLSSLVGTASGSCVAAADFVPDATTQKTCLKGSERHTYDCCPMCGSLEEMCTEDVYQRPEVKPTMECSDEKPPADSKCVVHSTVQTGTISCDYDKFCRPTTMGTMEDGMENGQCMFIMTMTCDEDGEWETQEHTVPVGYKSCEEACARRRSRRLLFATSRTPPPDPEPSMAELCGC